MNISSICRNFDDLQTLLAKINVKFNVIGITETRLNKTSIRNTNIDLSGYSFEHTPTETNCQSGKLLERTYHCRSTYRYAEARIEWAKNTKNWYVVLRIKSVFSKLALLLRAWQSIFFTKLERRVKQRNSPFKKFFYRLKLKLYHF